MAILATVSLGHVPQGQARLLHGWGVDNGRVVFLDLLPLPFPGAHSWGRLCSPRVGLWSPLVFSPGFQVGVVLLGFLPLYLQPSHCIFHLWYAKRVFVYLFLFAAALKRHKSSSSRCWTCRFLRGVCQNTAQGPRAGLSPAGGSSLGWLWARLLQGEASLRCPVVPAVRSYCA